MDTYKNVDTGQSLRVVTYTGKKTFRQQFPADDPPKAWSCCYKGEKPFQAVEAPNGALMPVNEGDLVARFECGWIVLPKDLADNFAEFYVKV